MLVVNAADLFAAHRTDPLLLVIQHFSQRCWERQQPRAACITLCLAFIHSFVLCTVYHSIMGKRKPLPATRRKIKSTIIQASVHTSSLFVTTSKTTSTVKKEAAAA